MHIHFLDPYQHGSSWIHNTDARIKLVLGLALILTIALIAPGTWSIYLLVMVMVVILEFISAVGINYYLKRSLLAIPFILAAFPLVFTVEGATLYAFTLGAWQVPVSLPGVERFASIALKSWFSIQVAVLLTATTPFPELLAAMRALRIPRMLVAILGLMWRYLFVLADEAIRLMRARAARSGTTFDPGTRSGGSLIWRAQTAGGMAGNLFVRSIDRSERIYAAMLSRGYDGEIRSLPQEKMDSFNWAILVFGGVFICLVLILSTIIAG